MRGDDAGDSLGHLNAGVFQGRDFVGVVGEQAHALYLEVEQDLGRHFVITQVGFKPQAFVRFHGVGAAVLQLIGAEFVEQSNAAPFLMLVDQQAAAFFGNQVERELQLRAAVAAEAMEDIAGEALGVNANKRWVAAR